MLMPRVEFCLCWEQMQFYFWGVLWHFKSRNKLHLISFCSRFSNMGFFSVFQGRKGQWHRRSNGRGSGALLRLLSHRQVSIALLKFTGVNSGNCLVSFLEVFSCLTAICCQWKCALFWRWRGGILQIAQQLLSNWQHKLFPTATVKGNTVLHW